MNKPVLCTLIDLRDTQNFAGFQFNVLRQGCRTAGSSNNTTKIKFCHQRTLSEEDDERRHQCQQINLENYNIGVITFILIVPKCDRHKVLHLPVTDPGFPRGATPTYYLANFSRKLHENEEILAQGTCPSRSPLRSATACRCFAW